MRNMYWLTDVQMERLKPFFPKSHGKPRVDDRRVISGIIFINRNGLRWCDPPRTQAGQMTWCDRGGRSPRAHEVRYNRPHNQCHEENGRETVCRTGSTSERDFDLSC